MFIEILTFKGLDYRDASLVTMYFVVLGISIPKIWLLLFLNRTTTGITMQNEKVC